MTQTKNLLIPVYLNQKLVFDLLAMLKGGISTVTQVSYEKGNNNSLSGGASAKFGLSDALSTLFKVDLNTKVDASQASSLANKESYEKVHTPASLFFELRNIMEKDELIISNQKLSKCLPGDFVEFEVILTKNPLYDLLMKIPSMMKLAQAFSDNEITAENELMLDQVNLILDDLTKGNNIDLVANFEDRNLSAVLTLDKQFLNDPNMSDIIDGKFKILGKVIKKVDSSKEAISLLRHSTLHILSKSALGEALSGFNDLEGGEGLNFPKVTFEVCGPSFQVIPIAIYA